MSQAPIVTVGIPFYNAEATLLDAIRSVFAQTFQDWELILMDDGSTDGSLDIALSVQDPRVRVVGDGRNLKLPARLNQIHQQAAGEYAARMDADDLMHPDRLMKQVDLLKQQPDVDVVGTLMYAMDSQRSVHGVQGSDASGFEPRDTLDRIILMHATVCGKTQWFRQNPYDETFVRAQDCELWCRTCRHSRFATIIEPLYFVNEGEAGDIFGKYLRNMRFARRILWTYGPELVGWPGTFVRVGRTYAKGAAHVACRLLNKQDVLVRRRSRALAPEQQEAAEVALERIMNTTVPLAVGSGFRAGQK